MTMPWDRFTPDADTDPATAPPPLPEAPPPPNLPKRPDVDVGALLRDLLVKAARQAAPALKEQAAGYARDSLGAAVRGERVDHANPTITAEDMTGRELVVADAKSRSWRTLVQGLIFDVFAAIVAAIAMLSGADPFVKETWVAFGVLLKSVVSAALSYAMRLKVTPTIHTEGDTFALMPVPRLIEEKS